jgi:quercetin dioxygenase-like cupin family protein
MKVRRVVTGHNAKGEAIVLTDDEVVGQSVLGGEAEFAVIWKTTTNPVDNDDATDRAAEPTGLTQENGTLLRVVHMPPGMRSVMHRTNSLDYGIVLEGQVDLELDSGRITHLKTGDIVIQRGTIHAWVNPRTTPACMAFVLIDARPATCGSRTLDPVAHEIMPD